MSNPLGVVGKEPYNPHVETWDGPFHKRKITKGIYGEQSKIFEEVEELLDAREQDQTLMLLIELADIYGAIEGYFVENGRQDTFSTIISNFESSGPRSPIHVRDLDLELSKYYLDLVRGDLKDHQLKGILEVVLRVARGYSLGIDELAAYAELRGEVAKHALAKAENKGE